MLRFVFSTPNHYLLGPTVFCLLTVSLLFELAKARSAENIIIAFQAMEKPRRRKNSVVYSYPIDRLAKKNPRVLVVKNKLRSALLRLFTT